MRRLFNFIIIATLGVVCGAGVMVAYYAVASPVATETPAVVAASAPAWLVIPSIKVDAPIKPVGIAADGDLAVPSDALHVAWYEAGPRPGEPGAAVIDGHLDTKNSPEAVFYNLDELKPGDEIDVQTVTGQTIVFKVTSVQEIPYDAPTQDIFISTSSIPELNLITCAGDWVPEKKIYNQRFVVFAQEAAP